MEFFVASRRQDLRESTEAGVFEYLDWQTKGSQKDWQVLSRCRRSQTWTRHSFDAGNCSATKMSPMINAHADYQFGISCRRVCISRPWELKPDAPAKVGRSITPSLARQASMIRRFPERLVPHRQTANPRYRGPGDSGLTLGAASGRPFHFSRRPAAPRDAGSRTHRSAENCP